MSETRGWYVVHVFSGYEQKIERQILNLIETNTFFANNCFGVKVPIQKRTEIRDGKPKVVSRKLMPGYILVDLNLPRKVANEPWTLDDEEKQKRLLASYVV